MATSKFSRNVAASAICAQVGRKIKDLRQKRGWSQQLLADHAQIERSHLARIEDGVREPGLMILEKIADALEVPVWELLKF